MNSQSEPRRVVRRIVRRRRHIPKLSDLYSEASEHGMTVKEYLDYLNNLNMTPEQRARRRNPASTYDMGPEPWREKPREDQE